MALFTNQVTRNRDKIQNAFEQGELEPVNFSDAGVGAREFFVFNPFEEDFQSVSPGGFSEPAQEQLGTFLGQSLGSVQARPRAIGSAFGQPLASGTEGRHARLKRIRGFTEEQLRDFLGIGGGSTSNETTGIQQVDVDPIPVQETSVATNTESPFSTAQSAPSGMTEEEWQQVQDLLSGIPTNEDFEGSGPGVFKPPVEPWWPGPGEAPPGDIPDSGGPPRDPWGGPPDPNNPETWPPSWPPDVPGPPPRGPDGGPVGGPGPGDGGGGSGGGSLRDALQRFFIPELGRIRDRQPGLEQELINRTRQGVGGNRFLDEAYRRLSGDTDFGRIRRELQSVAGGVADEMENELFRTGGQVDDAIQQALRSGVRSGFGAGGGGVQNARQNILNRAANRVSTRTGNRIAQAAPQLAQLAVQEDLGKAEAAGQTGGQIRGQDVQNRLGNLQALRGFTENQAALANDMAQSVFGGRATIEQLQLAREQMAQNERLVNAALQRGGCGAGDVIGSVIQGGGSGALSGAAVGGSVLGLPGAAAGGILGALGGLFGGGC